MREETLSLCLRLFFFRIMKTEKPQSLGQDLFSIHESIVSSWNDFQRNMVGVTFFFDFRERMLHLGSYEHHIGVADVFLHDTFRIGFHVHGNVLFLCSILNLTDEQIRGQTRGTEQYNIDQWNDLLLFL